MSFVGNDILPIFSPPVVVPSWVDKTSSTLWTAPQGYWSTDHWQTFLPYEIKWTGTDFTGDVKIDLFDITGKSKGVLVNESLTKGMHRVKINAKHYDMSNGVYFIRLQVNNSIYIKKLIKM